MGYLIRSMALVFLSLVVTICRVFFGMIYGYFLGALVVFDLLVAEPSVML